MSPNQRQALLFWPKLCAPRVPGTPATNSLSDINHEPSFWRQKHRPKANSPGSDYQRERTPQCLGLQEHSADLAQLDTRIESIDVQLAKINAELQTYQQRISKMRDGPGKNALRQKVSRSLPTLAVEAHDGLTFPGSLA